MGIKYNGKWIPKFKGYYTDDDFPDYIIFVMAKCSVCGSNHNAIANERIFNPCEDEADYWKPIKYQIDSIMEHLSNHLERTIKSKGEYCQRCGSLNKVDFSKAIKNVECYEEG